MATITQPSLSEHRLGEPKAGVPVGQLFRDVVRDLRDITKGEVDLLKAEMRERIGRLEKAMMLFALGGAVALAAALTLLYTLNMGLTALFALFLPAMVAVWLAPLVLAIAFGVVGAVVLGRGADVMRDTEWKPVQTRQTLQEDKEWLKSKVG